MELWGRVTQCWDGGWNFEAYFDEGKPRIGGKGAQSWWQGGLRVGGGGKMKVKEDIPQTSLFGVKSLKIHYLCYKIVLNIDLEKIVRVTSTIIL